MPEQQPDAERDIYGGGPVDVQGVIDGTAEADEGHPVGAQAKPEPEPEPSVHKFDPRYREPLSGMIYIGRLEDTFDWGGHRFVVRTLTLGEQIEAGLLIKPTLGTRVEMKAHQAATVAAGLISVDGNPLMLPIGNAEIEHRDKYQYLMKNWHAPTIDVVYSRIYRLELRARELVDALGEADGQGR